MFNLTQYIKNLWVKYKNLKNEVKESKGFQLRPTVKHYQVVDWDEIAMIIALKDPHAAHLGMFEDLNNTCACIYCDGTLICHPDSKFVKGMTPLLILEMEEGDYNEETEEYTSSKEIANAYEVGSCSCSCKYNGCTELWPQECYQYLPKEMQYRLMRDKQKVDNNNLDVDKGD